MNRAASLKQKHARANNSPFINKTVIKAIMKQIRLKNKFINYSCEGNMSLCFSGKKSKAINYLILKTSPTTKSVRKCEAIFYRYINESHTIIVVEYDENRITK